MKKTVIIALIFFVGFTLNAQQQHEVDSYKIAFYSKDATGVFKEMSGSVESNISDIASNIKVADEDSTELDLSFNLKIKVGSINTGNGVQNKHAKSSEWFHAEKYPTIDFVSTRVYKSEKVLKKQCEKAMKKKKKVVKRKRKFGAKSG